MHDLTLERLYTYDKGCADYKYRNAVVFCNTNKFGSLIIRATINSKTKTFEYSICGLNRCKKWVKDNVESEESK